MTTARKNSNGTKASSEVSESEPKLETMHRELTVANAMSDNSPVNIIRANTDLVIEYVNAASANTLRSLAHLLPCAVDEIVGQSIDIFHKDPSYQRKILSDDRNLPHRAQIALGDEVLDLLVTATYDEHGAYLGPMVTWEVITEKLRLERSAAEKSSVVENAPVNIILAEPDLVISYLNPSSINTLKKLEHLLPCRVDEIVGQSVDIFHKDPAHQRRILADPSRFPHRAIIELGDEKLDLLVSATYDNNGEYTGPMITWEVVTEKLRNESAANEKAAIVENAPINIMLANNDGIVTYMNPASERTLRTIETELPIRVDQIVGSSYDVFHKNPDHQRRLLADPKNLPHEAQITVGGEILQLSASAMYNTEGDYVGPMVAWSLITEQVKMKEREQAAAEQTRGLIEQVVESANQFAESSQVIAEGAQGLALGAQTQSASVEEMSASIEELARSIESVKENASEANTVAQETTALAEEGGTAVQKSVEAMDLIKSSSSQIGEIIQVISEIASQTNLLALNAAIEAARAGEHGLGFAVVADEVRKLAERSSEAAKEISTLIRESTQRVEDGVALSEQTGSALQKIIQGVDATGSKIAEIATATVQQASNAAEVSNAIQSISEVTEQTASASEEMASSSEELGAQATSLRELVSKFDLSK